MLARIYRCDLGFYGYRRNQRGRAIRTALWKPVSATKRVLYYRYHHPSFQGSCLVISPSHLPFSLLVGRIAEATLEADVGGTVVTVLRVHDRASLPDPDCLPSLTHAIWPDLPPT